MRPRALRRRLSEGLLDFAWNEWAQMGLLVPAGRPSRWAQDPEALIVFTLEVARDDPRLFDELLDWLALNAALLSTRRLHALCRDAEDARLVDAALGWVARHGPRARHASRSATATAVPESLFRGTTTRVHTPDPSFAVAGWLRPLAEPSGKARRPDLHAPINLAFRLRELLGVGARAEVVRYLLTVDAPSVRAREVSESACFAKRNVHETLRSLHAAGTVRRWTAGNEQRYAIDRDAWARLLQLDELPAERPWPQLLGGLRTLLRRLGCTDLDAPSEYLRSSHARDLLEAVRHDFEHAGIHVGASLAAGAWDDLEALVNAALADVGTGAPQAR